MDREKLSKYKELPETTYNLYSEDRIHSVLRQNTGILSLNWGDPNLKKWISHTNLDIPENSRELGSESCYPKVQKS